MDVCNFEPFFVVFKPSSGKVRAEAGAKAEDIGRELRLGGGGGYIQHVQTDIVRRV